MLFSKKNASLENAPGVGPKSPRKGNASRSPWVIASIPMHQTLSGGSCRYIIMTQKLKQNLRSGWVFRRKT